ncbi:MAG TPA: glycosyltransferase 87 family protein [Candidatus Limnocylindrales bacterium]
MEVAAGMPVIGGHQTSSPLRGLKALGPLRIPVQLGIVAAVCYLSWLAIQAWGRPYDFFDMKIYHGAMVWWTQGGELYDYIYPHITLGYTYPPFAALTMLPMAGLNAVQAAWFNVAFGLIALTFVCAVLINPIARRQGWPRWWTVALAVPAFAAIEPVRESLGYGQVNLLLFALVIADLVALRKGWRWAGVGIGLATAIKLTPALFIIYLLTSRQWRTAITAAGTALAVTVATHLVVPEESATYWGTVIWNTERVGAADMTPNQSLAGLVARLQDTAHAPGLLWVSFMLVMLMIGLSRARTSHTEGDELTAFTIVGLTSNVVSPISWSHHLLWVIPAIIALSDQALRRRTASRGIAARGGMAGLREPIWFPALTGARHAAAAAALLVLFLVSPIWPYEHQLPAVSHWADGVTGVLWENSFVIALILLVAMLPFRPGAEPAFGPVAAVIVPQLRRVPRREPTTPRQAPAATSAASATSQPAEPKDVPPGVRGS